MRATRAHDGWEGWEFLVVLLALPALHCVWEADARRRASRWPQQRLGEEIAAHEVRESFRLECSSLEQWERSAERHEFHQQILINAWSQGGYQKDGTAKKEELPPRTIDFIEELEHDALCEEYYGADGVTRDALPHGSGNPFGDHYCTSCKKYREGEHGLSLPLCERVEARALPVKGRDGIRVKLDLKLKLGGRRDLKYCRQCEAELGQI